MSAMAGSEAEVVLQGSLRLLPDGLAHEGERRALSRSTRVFAAKTNTLAASPAAVLESTVTGASPFRAAMSVAVCACM
jgi:hypothetical protein